MAFFQGGGLDRLQGIQVDLTALEQGSLSNISRLLEELDARQDEFRALLDKKRRNEQSLQRLKEGKLEFDGETYELNDEFKNNTIELAHVLDLDEIEAAQLFLHASSSTSTYDRSALYTAVLLFHTRRVYLLDCLRLCTHYASTSLDDESREEGIKNFCLSVFAVAGSTQPNFFSKCLDAMEDVENWIETISGRMNAFAVTNSHNSEEVELMELQQDRLVRQHEALAEIMTDFERFVSTSQDNLQRILAKVRKLKKYDVITIHYMAPLTAMLYQFGRSDQRLIAEDALKFHNQLFSASDKDVWPLRQLQAAMRAIWLPSYTSRFLDSAPSASANASDAKDAEKRANQFIDALDDGAFHLLLLICREMKRDDWHDPTRHELSDFLLKDLTAIHLESCAVDNRFHRKFLECLQIFVESFISNMPDTIRRLKLEEDDQRRFLNGQLQQGEEKFNLEQFLVIVSYAYEDFPEASAAFWTDQDSNLHGFLVWASQRLSTPRAAAFCDMLITLSQPGNDMQCADAAHNFLLAEMPQTSGRMRRNSPLSWHHIYSEIEFFAERVRERLNAHANPSGAAARSDGSTYEERESTMMLESYLRLLAHLAVASPQARLWLLGVPENRVTWDLLYLCTETSKSRLRACGFDAIRGLLTSKTIQTGTTHWALLDEFIWKKSTILRTGGTSVLEPEQAFFSSLQDGLELPSAFTSLLTALCQSPTDAEMDYALPFPEALGASYRGPGMEAYVDAIFDKILCWSSGLESADKTQIRILRLRCMQFIATCLRSFNENLVVFANLTRINVDGAIGISNIATYIKLHPFARVMEWFYNERAIKALFETATQDIEEVDSINDESPLLLGIVEAVEIIRLILSLQPTYLNIVKPQLKANPGAGHRRVVANTALASFDDAILSHMSFIWTLGSYCACSQHKLNSTSLRLMDQLSASRKLNVPPSVGHGQRAEKSRLLTALERDHNAQTIARSLAGLMAWSEREHEKGPALPSFQIKLNLLRFLNRSLASASGRPCVAHLLLGFQCGVNALTEPNEHSLESEETLFGAIVTYLCTCPDGYGDVYCSWIMEVKLEAFQVLQKLWRNPLSARLTIAALMRSDFLFAQMMHQRVLHADSLWQSSDEDVLAMGHPEFWIHDSADAFACCLARRSTLLEYVASECREAKIIGSATTLGRIKSTVLGMTVMPSGERVAHASLLDLLDVLEFEHPGFVPLPESAFFNLGDIDACKNFMGDGVEEHNSDWVEQLLDLQSRQVASNAGWTEADTRQLQADHANISSIVAYNNRVSVVFLARQQYLKSWTQLIMVILQICEFDADQRNTLVLQLLHLVLPRFEVAIKSDQGVAAILAGLVRLLLSNVGADALTVESEAGSNVANDRLFQTFRIALGGILEVDSSGEVREMCCQICHGFIKRLLARNGIAARRRQALQALKACGSRLLETLSEEAVSGSESARLSAMVALMSFVSLASRQASRHVSDGLSQIGFVQVIVNSLASIPDELASVYSDGGTESLSQHEAVLSLLLCLAQTRYGALQVLNAGYFSALEASDIFSADPDIGLDIDKPQALTAYFRIMLAMLRVINAIVLSNGEENDQVIAAAHAFLIKYRSPILSVFKRNARIGSIDPEHEELLGQLVDNYAILMTTSGFMEAEPEVKLQQAGEQRFFS